MSSIVICWSNFLLARLMQMVEQFFAGNFNLLDSNLLEQSIDTNTLFENWFVMHSNLLNFCNALEFFEDEQVLYF